MKLKAADFAEKVDNPYFPIEKGTRWSYRGSDTEGTSSSSEVVATGETRDFAGITAHALRDRSTEEGKLIEIATEWYAQDKKGNVWYLGETVRDFESGGGKTEGSLYGDGPFQAGVTMMGKPIPGSCHRLVYEKGQSEDRLAVLSVKERGRGPGGQLHRGREAQADHAARGGPHREPLLRQGRGAREGAGRVRRGREGRAGEVQPRRLSISSRTIPS